MNTPELFELLLEMSAHSGFHTLRLGANVTPPPDLEGFDLGFRKRMLAGFDYEGVRQKLENELLPDIIYLLEDELGIFYSFFRFSPELEEELGCQILCIGPLLLNPLEPEEFQALMDEKQVDPEHRQDFREFFNQIPLIFSYESWNRMLSFYLERITGRTLRFEYIRAAEGRWADFAWFDSHYSIPPQPDVALTALESRYSLEDALMKAVAEGDTNEAMKLCHDFLQYRIVPRIPSLIRDKQNLLITFNTLLRKAAQAGGVHPLHIDHLSRALNIEINSLVNLDQLDRMNGIMVRKYCLLVKNYSRSACSSPVRVCLNQIDFYYHRELSLSSLAKLCSVSENHLSTILKKETGMTITDYINQTRIRQALILLHTTGLSIGEIATRCGYFDANYFTRMFKKQLGQSPRQYRDQMRHRNQPA